MAWDQAPHLGGNSKKWFETPRRKKKPMSGGPTTNPPPPPQPTAEPGFRLDFVNNHCNTLLMLSLVFAC